jgi:hypothetical protein
MSVWAAVATFCILLPRSINPIVWAREQEPSQLAGIVHLEHS